MNVIDNSTRIARQRQRAAHSTLMNSRLAAIRRRSRSAPAVLHRGGRVRAPFVFGRYLWNRGTRRQRNPDWMRGWFD